MKILEKRQLRSFVKSKQFRVPEPKINFIYPLFIIAFITGLLVFGSNDTQQEAPELKQTDTLETFSKFVERILKERRAGGETYFLGMVSEKMQEMLNDSVQMDFKGYHWRIGNDDILHINIRHGDFKTEHSRGQVNVTAKDYQKIYSIINTPDNIGLSFNKKKGEKYLKLSKYINKQKHTYILLISVKKWRLTGKTMYIKKAPTIKLMPF